MCQRVPGVPVCRQSKERRSKRDSKCGVTPPCSPECPADPARTPADPDDNLVWLSVHTRDPLHPHFHDTYEGVRVPSTDSFYCL